jgi:hypothetical protein
VETCRGLGKVFPKGSPKEGVIKQYKTPKGLLISMTTLSPSSALFITSQVVIVNSVPHCNAVGADYIDEK